MLICRSSLAGMLVVAILATVSSQAEATEPAPIFEKDFLDGYQDFKTRLRENTGFSWLVRYSAMGLWRRGETGDHQVTGELDLIAVQELFKGRGQFTVYYMDVGLLSGLSNDEFSTRNGNITPITDSDETSFLRQFWYRHSFVSDTVQLYGGVTEPILTFGDNRFAVNDRERFMNVPMSNVAAKDRTFSSPGLMATWDAKDWLTVGTSINHIKSTRATGRQEDMTFYYLLHLNFKPSIGSRESNYRFNYVLTQGDDMYEETNGLIITLDQDLTEHWGTFLRYDDTEFQTLTSPLNESFAVGVSHAQRFGRLSLGAFRTRSDQGGSFQEWGGEAFYKVLITDWLNASLHVQYIDPAKAAGHIFNVGGRVSIEF